MSDLDKALSQANKVMAQSPSRKGALPDGPTARTSSLYWVVGLIVAAACAGGYAFWSSISDTKSATKPVAVAPAKTAPPALIKVAKEPLPQVVLPPAPQDPALLTLLQNISLNAILASPPRVRANGKTFALGEEIVPGLKLKRVEKNAIEAEDAAGAVYRRTF